MPEIIDTADLWEIVRDRETLSSGLDSAPQKSINLAQIFKKFSIAVKLQLCVININTLLTSMYLFQRD
jgi:hypothetical protein